MLLEVLKAWRHMARANFLKNVVLPAIDFFDKNQSDEEQKDKSDSSSEELKKGR